MKKCPFCAEEIQNNAIVCRYCGREIGPVLTPRETNKCPQCAELIKAEAKVCRYCGYSFSVPEGEIHLQKSKDKKWRWGTALGIGLLIASFAAIANFSELVGVRRLVVMGEISPVAYEMVVADIFTSFLFNVVFYSAVALGIMRLGVSPLKTIGIIIGIAILIGFLLTVIEDGRFSLITPASTPTIVVKKPTLTPQPRFKDVMATAGHIRSMTLQACEADPNCRLVTVTPPWINWTPESTRGTWTPEP